MNKYRFSPSVLDKFQHLLDADQYFESDFNNTDDGPKQSLDEIVAEREQELLDALNKVDKGPIEAAARGTAFNEVVDQMVKYKYTDCDLVLIYDKTGAVQIRAIEPETITADCDGFSFTFDRALVEKVADMVQDGTMQFHAEAFLDVYGDRVRLHGFPDYIRPDIVTDLKTTSSYAFGKYERYWQRYAYPYILTSTGLMEYCLAFEFLVVEMKPDRKTGVIGGEVYRETYTDVRDPEACAENLRWICSGLILWITNHRDQITNQKVFDQA